MKQLHASGEDYLEAILVLKRKKGMVRSIDVARYLGVSKPSVCHAVNTLKDGGFLVMDEDHFLRLTDIGRDVAEKTYEKHCFFTRLLVDAGVEPHGTRNQRRQFSENKIRAKGQIKGGRSVEAIGGDRAGKLFICTVMPSASLRCMALCIDVACRQVFWQCQS